jgi:glyoxylate reductase
MKPGIVVINTARGAVIDEVALVDALESGQVASAGLDVFEGEPKIDERLLKNNKVLIVPHMGTYTYETQLHMEEWTINNVEKAVTEGYLITIVPEQRDLEKRL